MTCEVCVTLSFLLVQYVPLTVLRRRTTDLAWAQSSLSKTDHQANNVCLSSHQQPFFQWKKLPSGKSCCVRHLLAKYWLAGSSSIHRSVCPHWYSSFEEDTTRWDFSFDVTGPFSRKRTGQETSLHVLSVAYVSVKVWLNNKTTSELATRHKGLLLATHR